MCLKAICKDPKHGATALCGMENQEFILELLILKMSEENFPVYGRRDLHYLVND
ncbi:MAG: hypothetical protein ABI297_08925 [Ginsengibacter sp.]|jgi:hypothetical protein